MVGYQPPATPYVDLPSQTTAIWAADLNNATAAIANLDCRLLPCDVATTASTTLSGTGQTIDTVVITAGMRIFNKDDATGTNRGVYVAGSGSWARAADFKAGAVFRSGTTVIVTKGSQANREYSIAPGSGAQTGTVGSDSLTVTWINNTSGGGSGIPASSFTASGDLLAGTGVSSFTHKPVGFDGQVLIADSTTGDGTGVRWGATPGHLIAQSGTSVTQRNMLNFTGSGVTVSDDASGASSGGFPSTKVTIGVVGGGSITPVSFDANSVMNITAPGTYRCNIDHTTGNNDARIMIWEPRDDTIREVIIFAYISATSDTIYRFGPGTIAWDSGMGPYNSNTMPQWDVSPGSITVFRLLWMGQSYGWSGSVIASIPPYWTKPSSTGTVTNTESLGRGGNNSQTLNADVYFMRNLSATKQTWGLNALTQCFSANMRQRMQNNGHTWEFNTEFTTDGPRSADYRGTQFDFGGFFVNAGSGSPTGSGPVSVIGYNAVNDAASAKGGPAHEGGHAFDVLYYGGANPHPGSGIGNGSEPDTLNQHSTLITLWNDCVTGGASLGTNHSEWFAELFRCWVLGDNNTGTTSTPAGTILVNLGANTFGGTNTPGSRLQRYFTYMNGLGIT